jgi:DNA-binding CsgD family transcriptional regulator
MLALSQPGKEGTSKSTRPKDLFYERPKVALLDEKQWSYIQRRYHMSPREVQVAKLVCQGCNNEEVAKDLNIRYGTAKTHIRNIYRRIRVKNKIAMLLKFIDDATKFAAQSGTTPPIPIAEVAKPAKKTPTPSKIPPKS